VHLPSDPQLRVGYDLSRATRAERIVIRQLGMCRPYGTRKLEFVLFPALTCRAMCCRAPRSQSGDATSHPADVGHLKIPVGVWDRLSECRRDDTQPFLGTVQGDVIVGVWKFAA